MPRHRSVPQLLRVQRMARTATAAVLMAVLAACLVLPAPVSAQDLSDLSSPVYALLSRAEERGVIAPLPLLRPYPLQLVMPALRAIVDKGNRLEREQAAALLEELGAQGRELLPGVALPAPIHASVEHESRWLDDHAGTTGLLFQSTGSLTDMISYAGRGGASLTEHPTSAAEPRWTYTDHDGVAGGARMNIGSQSFSVDFLWRGTMAVGTKDLYFQAGINRSVLGPLYDSSVVLGAQAPAAGHFSLTYRRNWLTFSSALLELQAVYAEDPATGTVYSIKSRLGAEDAFPSKFLALHTLMLSPVPWLDLALIQPLIFGGRFDPLYLVPFQLLQYTQIYLKDYDNALIGGMVRLRLPWGIGLSAVMLVDDWNFNEMVKGNLDSGQNKFALQAGLSWTPWFGVLESVRAQYTMVTPFMYTHTARTAINYLTYEHAGQLLGSILPPNSDELSLTVDVRPLAWLTTTVKARHVRHANGSDYGDGLVYGTGTVYDDGITPSGTAVFVGAPSTFMTQAVIEKTTHLSLDVEARIPVWKLSLGLSAGYTFEAVRNPDLVEAAELEINHAFRIATRVRY